MDPAEHPSDASPSEPTSTPAASDPPPATGGGPTSRDCGGVTVLGPVPRGTPRIHQSTALTLLENRHRAWAFHPDLGKAQRPSSDAMARGTLLDAMIFCPQRLEVLDFDDYRTKAAKLARDEARAAKLIPVLAHEQEKWAPFVTAVLRQMQDEKLFPGGGRSQDYLEWDSPTVEGVKCAGALDYWWPDRNLVIDFKTTTSADDDSAVRSIVDHGYDIQHAAYTEAVAVHTGRVPRFVFVFAEIGFPFDCNFVRLGGSLREMGRLRWERACRVWRDCVERDEWPAYGGAHEVEATPWQLAMMTEQERHVEALREEDDRP